MKPFARVFSLRFCVPALALSLCASLADSAHAQTSSAWPDRPVRIVVPAPAGSSLDIIVRTLGDKLKDKWKQPLVVENKPGAGGMLGMDAVAKATPDGYTLGLGFNGPIAFGPHMYKKMPYAPGKDLLPIVLTTSQPNVLAVHASNPANTLPELMAWAKAQGSKLSYGSVGNGSSSHLTMALLESLAGFDAVHVPYNGAAPATGSVLAGDTAFSFENLIAIIGQVRGNTVVPLAVTTATRSPQLPDVPTIAEAGLAGFNVASWFGIVAPGATPRSIVDKVAAAFDRALKEPQVLEQIRKLGAEPLFMAPREFDAYMKTERLKWEATVKASGATVG